MELTTVSCNNCGAPLRIPADARFVTCNHCSTQLVVKRNESVTFTKQLGEISQRTERIAEDVAELKYRQELEDIDRRWEIERESFMVTGKHGRRSIPTTAGSVIGGIVVVVFGLFWTVTAAGIGGGLTGLFGTAAGIGGGLFALFGVAFIVFGIVMSVISFTKAEGYAAAERRYRRQRAEAMGRREK